MNIEHHQEQMEAARQEFAMLWISELLPRCWSLDMDRKIIPAIEHLCWHTFLKTKGVK